MGLHCYAMSNAYVTGKVKKKESGNCAVDVERSGVVFACAVEEELDFEVYILLSLSYIR